MAFTDNQQPSKVLIVGGGVAGLEAALALRDLAGERVSTTLLAPEPDFVYRPLRVREPFAQSEARRYALEAIARDIEVELRQDAFKWLDPSQRTVHTEAGERLSYDALLLALGARLAPRFRHALTLDDRRLDEQLHGLIHDVEGGYANKLAGAGRSVARSCTTSSPPGSAARCTRSTGPQGSYSRCPHISR